MNSIKKIATGLLACSMLLITVGFKNSESAIQDTVTTNYDGRADSNSGVDETSTKGLPTQLGVTEDTKESNLVKYEKVVSNENLVLYADMSNGLFALKNKKTGKIWYSTPNDSELDEVTVGNRKSEVRSQLLVYYVPVAEITTSLAPKTANSHIHCVSKGTVEVTQIDNGIRVIYTFQSLELVIPVEYTLEKDCLQAKLNVVDIKEGDKAVITAVQLLPAFGAGNWNSKGQLFIPDGSGALINFNNGIASVDYDEMVYGDELAVLQDSDTEQKETIHMPVFGVLSDGDALMGIITEGDAAASITAFNGNSSCGYNGVSSKVNLRLMTKKDVFSKTSSKETVNRLTDTIEYLNNYTVRYYALANADYVDMAARYRSYLIEEKGLGKNVQRPSFHVDMYGCIDRKSSFLGIPYTKKTVLTTFEQAEQILESLRKQGIDKLAMRYLGWSNYGVLNNTIPEKASPISALGGKKDFLALSEYMKQNQFSFYPNVDFVRFRSGSEKNAIKTSFKETAYQYEFMRSVYATKLGLDPYCLLTPQKIQKVTEKFLPSYQKLGVSSISLGTLGNYLYSNLHPEKGTYRSEFPEWVVPVLNSYKKLGLEIVTESANAYTFPYVTRIYNAPTQCSAYDIFDEEIPFYQLVLHGYISMTTAPMTQSMDSTINFLKAVETGNELLYSGIYAHASVVTGTRYDELYSTTYTLWMQSATEKYEQLQPLLEEIYDKPIIAHETQAPNIMMTTFEGGCQVIVNYNDEQVTINGVNIAAYSFKVIGK